MKTAILFGGSGLVGGHCLQLLLEHPAYEKVSLFLRKPLEKKHPKLVQHIIDFKKLEDYNHLIQGNDLFCCLGTTIKQAGSREAFRQIDYGYPSAIAKMAHSNGIPHFSVVTSLGASSKSPSPYLQTKGELEDELMGLNFHSLHIFRPSLLVGDRGEFRIGEEVLKKTFGIFSIALQGPLKKYRPIEGAAVAFAMVHSAQTPNAGNHTFNSDEIQKINDSR